MCRFNFNPIPFSVTMRQQVVDRKHTNTSCSKSWNNSNSFGVTFSKWSQMWLHGPLARNAKLRVAYAPGIPGMFSHHRGLAFPKCVSHVQWCMPGSLTSGFLSSRWRGKHSGLFRRMGNPQLYLSGKRPIIEVKGRWCISHTKNRYILYRL